MPKGNFVGEFELYVLLAVAQLGEEAYGLSIRRLIAERTGRDTAIGAVYATLARLLDKGLVREMTGAPRPVSGGRARRVFRLSAAGDRALAHSTAMLASMQAGWTPHGGKLPT